MNVTLTEKELMARYIMEVRFIPTLHNILSISNQYEYKRWGGNACRQTAIFGVKLLEELLPEYQWQAWDGIFDDVIMGKPRTYNHAWIYGINRKDNRRLFVDLSRQYQERLFILTDRNKYPKNNPEYANLVEQSRGKIDIDECMSTKEYYTQMDSHDLLNWIKKSMKES